MRKEEKVLPPHLRSLVLNNQLIVRIRQYDCQSVQLFVVKMQTVN